MWKSAQQKDDDEIVAMCLLLNKEDPAPKPVPESYIRNTLSALRNQKTRGKALVLELDGKIEGYSLLISFWSNELGGEICNIHELYVKKNSRGKGHGTALLKQLKNGDNTLWEGCPVALELETTPANTRAHDLYTNIGFSNIKNQVMRLPLF